MIGRGKDFGIGLSTVMLSQTTFQFKISFQTAMENSSLWCLDTDPSFTFSSPFGLSFSSGMTKAKFAFDGISIFRLEELKSFCY